MIDIFKHVVTNRYAVAQGRASRRTYWLYVLATLIVGVVLNIAAQASSVFTIVALIWSLLLFVPGVCLSVRRLHDIGKSGWVLLIGLIPIVGGIILIVWMATAGDFGGNEYGPPPTGLD